MSDNLAYLQVPKEFFENGANLWAPKGFVQNGGSFWTKKKGSKTAFWVCALHKIRFFGLHGTKISEKINVEVTFSFC